MQRVHINANCLTGGVYRTRSEAALEQMGGGCNAVLLAKIGWSNAKSTRWRGSGTTAGEL